jgi:hypothetical protein
VRHQWALFLLLACSAGTTANDEVKLETSTVTGNRELPKVMVIVPWKHATPGEVPGRPVESLLDETLRPVGRAEFRRELAHYRDLGPGPKEHISQEE